MPPLTSGMTLVGVIAEGTVSAMQLYIPTFGIIDSLIDGPAIDMLHSLGPEISRLSLW